jgi:hypothetical protein
MSKIIKPAFQSVEVDLIDKRLETQAAEKGIPKLVTPATPPLEHAHEAVPVPESAAEMIKRATHKQRAVQRDRMVSLNVEVPAYVWIELKTRAAQEMMSVKHFTLRALREQGIEVRDADMVEDGRRMRGSRGRL